MLSGNRSAEDIVAARKKKNKSPATSPSSARVRAQVEQLELVQRALELLDEAERRASGLKDDATREVQAAVQNLREGAQGLRERVEQAEEEVIAKARSSVDAFVARLTERTTREVDLFLDRVGLMRKERHQEAVAALKKTGKKSSSKKKASKKTKKKAPKKAKTKSAKKASAKATAGRKKPATKKKATSKKAKKKAA
jgi:hypothetical protein